MYDLPEKIKLKGHIVRIYVDNRNDQIYSICKTERAFEIQYELLNKKEIEHAYKISYKNGCDFYDKCMFERWTQLHKQLRKIAKEIYGG